MRILALCGVLSAACFIAADALGIALRPDYSPVSQAISELLERGAPNKALLDGLILGFHGLVVPFAWALQRGLPRGPGGPTGPALLAAAGATGVVLTLFFPCDPGCAPPVTWRGLAHILIAIPMGFAVLFGLLAIGIRLRTAPGWRAHAAYTAASFAVGVALAVVTVAMAETRWVGALERALTLSYLQWYVVTGARLALRPPPPTALSG
ncbi:hypothetical protein DDZ18_01145 [Marinicauda salina]|uniref:DUF998 domain-containing protein n=1 Tax=Marinicauda salina TaxID=2135793 RepID=A0A2U2BW93_9PROT|nr:DUF998 domain-containing protein [Marinicauda salina]PWE18244.1 hypothetical protein DDZ18_01145 [Marinicauda salina]